jgi:DNA-binding MarR family transcriptional regulator
MRDPTSPRSSRPRRSAQTDIQHFVVVLMYRIVARAAEAATAEVSRFGFNIKGSRVLVALLERGVAYVGELGDSLALDSSTLSHLLRRLHRQGLIERTRREDDNRSVEVTLTSKGLATAKLCQSISSRIEATVLEGLTDAQIGVMRQQLLRIAKNVESKLRPVKGRGQAKHADTDL